MPCLIEDMYDTDICLDSSSRHTLRRVASIALCEKEKGTQNQEGALDLITKRT